MTTEDKFHKASDDYQNYLTTFAQMTSLPMVAMAEYRLPNGLNCVGTALLFEPNVAVQRSFMPKDARFPKHVHEEVEHLIIYYGELQITVGDEKRIFKAGEHVNFDPHVVHEVLALTDCWVIGITIPHSSGYPRG